MTEILPETYSEPRLTDFVARPDYGTVGRTTKVRTNFFRVTSLPESNIIHYDVTISPDVPPVINRKVYEQFEAIHRNGALNGIKPVFDGMIFVFNENINIRKKNNKNHVFYYIYI